MNKKSTCIAHVNGGSGWFCRAHTRYFLTIAALVAGVVSSFSASERINQEGRILGSAPVVTKAVLFNTAEADAILAAMQIFPVTSPWNEDISRRPLLSNSDAMIAQIMSDLSSSRRTLRLFTEMNFVLVPDGQPKIPVEFVDYPDESDPSPYPIPANMPIETWPRETGTLTLQQWQMDINDDGGDRHAIVVQPEAGFVWEMWQAKLTGATTGSSGSWEASNGAKFDLKSNAQRPAGWTSGDAAGLSMFPALVRYDECERGIVEHAMRLVVKRTRVGPIYPATHQASAGNTTDPKIPAMGQRLRLKASYAIPAGDTKYEKAVLLGLKKYGAIVADNGGFFSISITPDDRYPDNAFAHISSLSITNFEVVQTTGVMEGPRSSGAPLADAGADFSAGVGEIVTLQGHVAWTNRPPSIRWSRYSGPGDVVFNDPTRTNATVSFAVPGTYTLMLSADDAVHAVACDAVVVNVGVGISAKIEKKDKNTFVITWSGGSPPYIVEMANSLPTAAWVPMQTNSAYQATLSVSDSARFFRIKSQ